MKAGELPTTEKIKEVLRLPEGNEGDEKLEKMLSSFGEDFTQRERLFILFYTSPMSKTCGKISRSGAAVGASFKSWGDWVIRQSHVRQKINEILNINSLQQIEDIFRDDIKYCQKVLNCDRTAFKKDNTVKLEDKNLSFDVIDDKQIKELSVSQRKMVSGFNYDKNGKAHYDIETRTSARQALLTYYKLLKNKISGDDGNNATEAIVTLEGIRDKATAKIQIIQHNNSEAQAAGDFIETMSNEDEEA